MMTLLSATDRDLLRRYAGEAERTGRLHPGQLALIHERQWFRMMVPRRYGGQALPLPDVVRTEEALSRADGSVGWTVTLCSGAGWFAGFFPPSGSFAPAEFFPPDGLRALFADPQLCIAGSGMASGRADAIPGGYRITGRWGYASGAHHATAFTANCAIWADGAPVRTAEGDPLVRPFLFLKSEVRILSDWNAVGLVATGSHGFEVMDLDVPAARGFAIDASAAVDDDPLYRYPFLQLAEATLAVNNCGMAAHFLDCCSDVFGERIGKGQLPAGAAEEMMAALEKARSGMTEAREAFYAALDASWAKPEEASFQRVSLASHTLAARSRHYADLLYPYAGLAAARVDSGINRVWRDLHTASQHPLLVFRS